MGNGGKIFGKTDSSLHSLRLLFQRYPRIDALVCAMGCKRGHGMVEIDHHFGSVDHRLRINNPFVELKEDG